MKSIIDGVVRGIGGYGNCVGVPMLTGNIEFDKSYNKNVLVNAMCVGYFGFGEIIVSAKVSGPGNLVVYVGAKTGRDGVHGARMASESFSANDESKKPNIQIGDPFFEKLLIESCLEVIQANLVVSIQDMGAAGLISSTFEMASKGGVGIEMQLDKVPLRDSTLAPSDILVSESQERMVLICEPSKLEAIQKIFAKWGLDAVTIGKITKERKIKIIWKKEVLTEIDPDLLVENAPLYDRPFVLPKKTVNRTDKIELGEINDANKELLTCLKSLMGGTRKPVYRQYDQRVGTQTVKDCSHSVGVVALPSGRALGIVLGGRPHIMRFDPSVGGIDSIAYPALQLACKGFQSLAASDGLNFGNPEKPNIMGELVSVLRGMDSMCRVLEAPIISGNVSLYNETEGQNITSTPCTVVLGVRDDLKIPNDDFEKDAVVYLVSKGELLVGGNGGGNRY
jgi:phosphoribosylformylglycinamidine synthase